MGASWNQTGGVAAVLIVAVGNYEFQTNRSGTPTRT